MTDFLTIVSIRVHLCAKRKFTRIPDPTDSAHDSTLLTTYPNLLMRKIFTMVLILLGNIFCLIVFQIHLHDPAENPVMSDQGFSLAPGSYTKVAVRKVEVRVLVS